MEYSEYLNLAVQLINRNKLPGEPLTAAALGNILRKAAPESGYREFGKASLREVLEDLRELGRVVLTETSNGAFAVELAASDANLLHPTIEPKTFNPLHKAVWEAFTFATPPGRRFLNRLSGLVRSGLNDAPTPVDEWVEITPIPANTQLGWALEFAQSLDPSVRAAVQPVLNEQGWNGYRFVATLRDRDMQGARAWNRLRSTKVAEHAQEWLAANAVPPKLVFEQQSDIIQGRAKVARQSVDVLRGEQETRTVVLAALARLPLSQLLQIPIPVGVVLEALSLHPTR